MNQKGQALIVTVISSAILLLLVGAIWELSRYELILGKESIRTLESSIDLLTQNSSNSTEKIENNSARHSTKTHSLLNATLKELYLSTHLNGIYLEPLSVLRKRAKLIRCKSQCKITKLILEESVFFEGNVTIEELEMVSPAAKLVARGKLLIKSLTLPARSQDMVEIISAKAAEINIARIDSDWSGTLQLTSLSNTLRVNMLKVGDLLSCHTERKLVLNSAFGTGINRPPQRHLLTQGCPDNSPVEKFLLLSSIQ